MIASVADPQTANASAGTNLLKNSIKLGSFYTVKRSKNVQRNFVTLALQLYHQDKYKISGFNKRSPETSST